jgi:YggT family protein
VQNALLFIIRTLFDLYILTFALRLLLQWTAVDKRNPLVQFIFRVTNPLVVPLRRVLPPVGRVDTASVVALFGLQLVATGLIAGIGCGAPPELLTLLGMASMNLVRLAISILTWSIIIYAVLSWVSPGGYNPGAALVSAIVEPVLAPVRRLIPLIGGVDLSPLFAIIGLQALALLVPAGMACGSVF